jgi:hypothetical protein
MREEESTLTIDENGDKYWRNKKGKLHRIDGPAIELTNGTKYWYQNGVLHRIDGPAVEYGNGNKAWWQNGKLHRIDGPAVYNGELKQFYLRGEYFKTKEAFFEALTPEEKEIALFSENFLNA